MSKPTDAPLEPTNFESEVRKILLSQPKIASLPLAKQEHYKKYRSVTITGEDTLNYFVKNITKAYKQAIVTELQAVIDVRDHNEDVLSYCVKRIGKLNE